MTSVDPRGGYFAWRTTYLKRQSALDITYDYEMVLRECWSAAYQRGLKDGVLTTVGLRDAADAYRNFGDMIARWEVERDAISLIDAEITRGAA
jgi:hypothetical protein